MRRFFKWLGVVVLVALAGGLALGWTPDTDPEAMRAKYANAASRFVDVGGGLRIHVRDEGPRDAPVLVLLHGSNASLHTWDPWTERLKGRYRVVRLDQIGHGLTGPNPSGRYDAAAFVSSLDATLARLGVDRFVLAGNSMGGWIAWNYALAHPEKLAGLILVDASGAPETRPTAIPIGFRIARTPGLNLLARRITPRSLVERSVRQSMTVQAPIDDALVDRYWELLRYPGNREAVSRRFATQRNAASPADMAKIRVPALLLWGDQDTLVPLEAGRWFERHIPGARLIVYPGIGHIPMEETPDRSAADVAVFMSSLPKAPE